jgi:hypothetical protein
VAQIAQFLMHLAQDDDAREDFESSGEAAAKAMTAFGLSADQQALLQTNDSDKITAAVQSELGAGEDRSQLNDLISDMFCPPPPPSP